MSKRIEQEEIDDILESALADFDEEEDEKAAVVAKEKEDKKREEKKQLDEEAQRAAIEAEVAGMDDLQKNMAQFLEDSQNPAFQQVLEQAFRELGKSSEDGDNIQELLGSLQKELPNAKELAEKQTKASSIAGHKDLDQDTVNLGVAKTLQSMSEAATDSEGMEPAQVEQMGEEMMSEMLKKFEQLGEKNDFDSVVDDMMKQLLSKEVIYDPMRQICEKYPEWLAEKRDKLSKEDYERYGKQYQYFQQIVAVYETEPDNFERLQELMQDMQECGQPPSEIVKELAPGLEFSEDGMPIMPNMGPGMIPGMAGMAGNPVGTQMPGQEECRIM